AVPALLPALGLFVLEPLVLLAVARLGSVVFSTLGNGVLAFALYALAVVGGMTEQIGALVENPAAVNAGIVASLILPADAVYRRLVDGVVRGLTAGVPAGGQVGIDPQMMLVLLASIPPPATGCWFTPGSMCLVCWRRPFPPLTGGIFESCLTRVPASGLPWEDGMDIGSMTSRCPPWLLQ
ncbi:MAG: hypothetical protein ACPLQO_05005, partial [Desulfotomaculales bacterium]